MNLGILTEEVGSLEEAAQAYRQAIDLLGALPRGNPQRVANQEWYADTLGRLAHVHARTGRSAEAEHEFQEAVAQARELADRFPAESSYRRMVIEREIQLGSLHYTVGKLDQAEKVYQSVLDRLPASDSGECR